MIGNISEAGAGGMELFRTHSSHQSGSVKSVNQNVQQGSGEFGNLVTDALEQVSDLQIKADGLFERMLTHPDEVQPHDVSIAISKAELGLNITWAIVDRAVKAYNNITSMR